MVEAEEWIDIHSSFQELGPSTPAILRAAGISVTKVIIASQGISGLNCRNNSAISICP